MRTYTKVTTHGTDATLYDQLARLFGEETHDGVRWVALRVDGVELQFFASREEAA